MAQRIVVYWRDIPAQVIVRKGRVSAKRELGARFIAAIDQCAMNVGATDSDAYLAAWRRGDPEPCGDNLEAEVEAAARDLDAAFGPARLKALIDNQGRAEGATETQT